MESFEERDPIEYRTKDDTPLSMTPREFVRIALLGVALAVATMTGISFVILALSAG